MWNLDIRQSFTRFRHLLRVALLVVLVAATGPACIPTLLFTLDDPSPDASNGFGHSLAVGDVNGDGKADIAVGAAQENVSGNTGQGRAYVYSGADGSVLFTLDTPNPQAEPGWFGASVAVGDVNGDGRDDIAVGAELEDVGTNEGQGRAYVFSGVSGSLLLTLTVPSPNPKLPRSFGESLAVGDVNGDGKGDIAVGVPWEPVGGYQQGRAYVFSGADGSLLFTLDTPNPQPHANFGGDVAVGDVNGDGKADIVVGASGKNVGGNEWQGRAYVYSGADGSVLFTLDTPSPQAYAMFGESVAVGDVNGDGKADVAVGAPAAMAPYFGSSAAASAYVFSGASGSLLVIIPNPAPGYPDFGYSLAMGDVNGDGMADMAVNWAGRVYVYSPVPASVSAAADPLVILP